jgi:hypothetical protein
MRFFRRALTQAMSVVAFVAAGCIAPTLPLPPPALPTVSSEALGVVHLTSDRGVEANAIVIIYNRNPSVALSKRVGGAQADAQGSWEADVFASKGDLLDITQEIGTGRSPPLTLRVP